MSLHYYIEESALGWRVHQGSSDLVEGLALGKAIKYARQLARDQHERTGCAVAVELVIPEKTLMLAQHESQAVPECGRIPASAQ